jgi:CxxC-x17-CxxC domain-containing protein
VDFQDKVLRCSACGANFIFSAEEQGIFRSWFYGKEPRHCPSCRNAGNPRHGNGRNGRGTGRQMFPATCSMCGRDTLVPFEPRTGRRVYCRDCHHKVSTVR